MDEWDEVEVVQFFFVVIGDCDFGWVFQCDFIVVGFECVGWQIFDEVVVFDVVDCCVLVEVVECGCQVCCEGLCCVVLQVFVVVGVVDVFDEVEVFCGLVVFWIEWQVVEEVWQCQVDVVGIFGVVE